MSAPPEKPPQCGWGKGAVQGATQRGPDSWRLRHQGWAGDRQASEPRGLPQSQGHRAPRILGLRPQGTKSATTTLPRRLSTVHAERRSIHPTLHSATEGFPCTGSNTASPPTAAELAKHPQPPRRREKGRREVDRAGARAALGVKDAESVSRAPPPATPWLKL